MDERKYRVRLRFERPPGVGDWDSSALENRLNERLGPNRWGLHGDLWEGHAFESYAVHFDDHTAIPDLLGYIDSMSVQRVRIETYTAELGANFADAVVAGIRDLKSQIVQKINQRHGQEVCCRDTYIIRHGVHTGGNEDRLLKRIGTMTRLEERIEKVRSGDNSGQLTITLDEYEHVALYEAAHALWETTKIGDALKEAPEAIRVLMDSLTLNIDYLVRDEGEGVHGC